jgi:hypothetical protein
MLRLGRGKIDTRMTAAKWSAPPQSTRDLATLRWARWGGLPSPPFVGPLGRHKAPPTVRPSDFHDQRTLCPYRLRDRSRAADPSRLPSAPMIGRLDLKSDGSIRPVEWPENPRAAARSLFAARRPLRNIVVMVDAELIDRPDASGGASTAERSKLTLFSELVGHELVRLYRYADDGPPPDVASRDNTPGVYDGWAVIHHRDDAKHVFGVLLPSGTDGYALSGVFGNAADIAEQDTSTDSYRELDPRESARRRHADAEAVMVAAQAVQADLYVTERRYLHAARRKLAQGVTVCTPADALPILGLYFRRQGVYLLAHRFGANRGLFYWVGARELLPEAWRWFTACNQHAQSAGDDSMLLLGESLLQRVHRALEARDAVHISLNQPQNNDTQTEAIANLDTALVLLMGAVDVTARVAHRVLGLGNSEHHAAWQDRKRKGWLDQVRKRRPQLAAVVDAGTEGDHTLTILRQLRNSVHGTALKGMAFQRSTAPLESLVRLPLDYEAEILAAMDSLGGRSTWGVNSMQLGNGIGTHLDPGVLVDRLFAYVLDLLNALMQRTPMETLSGVALSAGDLVPPDATKSGNLDPFSPTMRTSIRWQLGF